MKNKFIPNNLQDFFSKFVESSTYFVLSIEFKQFYFIYIEGKVFSIIKHNKVIIVKFNQFYFFLKISDFFMAFQCHIPK